MVKRSIITLAFRGCQYDAELTALAMAIGLNPLCSTNRFNAISKAHAVSLMLAKITSY
jgi:hypothetical protein